MVFLHGLAGCWQNWLETIPEFARDRRVIALDSATLVGSSMGGFVAAEFAIRYRAQVERLCLASPAGLSMEHMRNERNRGARARVENWLVRGYRASRDARAPKRFNDDLRAFLDQIPVSPSPWSSPRAATR